MRLSDKTEIWSSGTKRFCEKYKRKECNIRYTRDGHWYYYFLDTDDHKSYNSLWITRHTIQKKNATMLSLNILMIILNNNV